MYHWLNLRCLLSLQESKSEVSPNEYGPWASDILQAVPINRRMRFCRLPEGSNMLVGGGIAELEFFHGSSWERRRQSNLDLQFVDHVLPKLGSDE